MRFPGFDGEWDKKSLAEICKMQAGKFIAAADINEKPLNGLFPCYGGNGLRGYTKSYNHEGRYSLIGRQGALCGNVTLADGRFHATEHAVVVTPFKNIDTVWLFYLLTHLNLNQFSTGMAQPGLSVQNLEKVETAIPKSIIEQQRISSFLRLIDQRITTQNKIIEGLESLIKGICLNLFHKKRNSNWRKRYLRDILIERNEVNENNYSIYSVSVSKGVINQIDYMGRSFASKNTVHYNVVNYGDIVYTKSPTGKFPYGIIKQSFIKEKVAVSPLYGVFIPKNIYEGNILHHYFNNPVNANNYLHSLIQKGAKNTVNISNQNFLCKGIYLPTSEIEIKSIAELLNSIAQKISLETCFQKSLIQQKQYILKELFI